MKKMFVFVVAVFLNSATQAAVMITKVTLLGSFIATAINNQSQVVGYDNSSAVLWENGTMETLFSGFAWDINNTGQIVGGQSGKGVLWSNGSVMSLESAVYGINDDGKILYSYNERLERDWLKLPPPDLYGSPLLSSPVVRAVNNNGMAVCGSEGNMQVWYQGVEIPLGLKIAYDINDLNQVVGYDNQGQSYLIDVSGVPEPKQTALFIALVLLTSAVCWRRKVM